MKSCSGRMLAATRVKISDSEKKVNEYTFDISSLKLVTRKYILKCHVAVVRNNGKENVQKKCAIRAKLLFCFTLDLLLFFSRSRCFPRLELHDFIFCLSKL